MTYDMVLMSPPSRMVNHYRPPLALMYVAEWYRKQNAKVKIIDVPMKQVVRNKKFWRNINRYINQVHLEMMEQLDNCQTEQVGISCYSTELSEVRKMVYDIRRFKQSKIVVGGIHPTLCPDDFNGWCNTVVRGRLDVGSPAYDLVDMRYYSNANPYAIRGVFLRTAYVLSSMGCPSNCSFCVAPRLRQYYKVGYIKNPTQLTEEIRGLKKNYSIDGFYIIDDLFTIDKRYVKDFCRQIKKDNLLWACNSRVNTIDEETISLMAEAGCVQMDFGVERGSNEELQRVKKGQTIEKVKETFALCRKNGIRTFANFLVNVPGENHRHFQDIRGVIDDVRPTISSFNTFEGYFGCELKNQIPKESVKRWVKLATPKYNSVTKQLYIYTNKRYVKTLLSSGRLLNYFKQLWLLVLELINQKFQS